MQITHRDFYLEVTRKQDELCSLNGAGFWPEIKRLLDSSGFDGDVQEMFSETCSSLGKIEDAMKDPLEQSFNEGWELYAKLAAMQYVFSLSTGYDKRWGETTNYAPKRDVEGMTTQDERDNWLAGDATDDFLDISPEWLELNNYAE